jgi:RNase H-fold protein (predicted Holliday junction resolvase)
MANILGIDYGKKYIGYAIGNDITLSSSTQGTIFLQKSKKDFSRDTRFNKRMGNKIDCSRIANKYGCFRK